MKLLRTMAIYLCALTTGLPAFSAEVAVLRNGFSLTFERKEIKGEITRLYISGGYVDVPSSEIASYEPAPEEQPYVPAPAQPAPANTADTDPARPAISAQTTASGNTAVVADLDQLVRDVSSRYRLDPDFVNSVIKAESNFKVHAVSRKGAQGLMQLMPDTAAQLGVANPFDPKANVEAGTAYLSYLLDLYHDDAVKALAAYNAGSHRVDQYHGVPPYMETRAYVAKIVREFNAKKMAQMKATAASNTGTTRKSSSGPSPAAGKNSKRKQQTATSSDSVSSH